MEQALTNLKSDLATTRFRHVDFYSDSAMNSTLQKSVQP